MSEDGQRVFIPPFPVGIPGLRRTAAHPLATLALRHWRCGCAGLGRPAFTRQGKSWWRGLSLGPTGYGNSPYQGLSSFAGNELLIGPDGLIEDGLLRTRDCEGNSLSTASVDYDVVVPFKNRLLETAWQTSAAGRVRIRSGILISIATNGRAGSTTMRYSGPCRQGTREPITPESPAEGHG
jgi:hypothetical protein